MNKLRTSFTLMNKWESGNYQEAVEMYFRLGQYTSRAMADGKRYHDEWKEETLKTGKLPTVFGGGKLIKPLPEHEIVVPIYDWLDLKVIIDLLDSPTIHEYKTGTASPEQYARSHQAGIYAMACIYDKKFVDRAVYHRLNQHRPEGHPDRVQTSRVWLTDNLVDAAQNYVVTVSGEIHKYFEDNDLYTRFAGRRKE